MPASERPASSIATSRESSPTLKPLWEQTIRQKSLMCSQMMSTRSTRWSCRFGIRQAESSLDHLRISTTKMRVLYASAMTQRVRTALKLSNTGVTNSTASLTTLTSWKRSWPRRLTGSRTMQLNRSVPRRMRRASVQSSCKRQPRQEQILTSFIKRSRKTCSSKSCLERPPQAIEIVKGPWTYAHQQTQVESRRRSQVLKRRRVAAEIVSCPCYLINT